MVEVAVQVFVFHLQIGQGRAASAAPVDDVIALVDQAFVVELNENFSYRLGKPLVHGEALPVPVAGRTQTLELVDDGAAGGFAPFPDGCDELLPPQLVPVGAIGGQFFFHHVLGGDTGMIRPGHPQDAVPFKSAITAHDVLHGVVQGVSHVQHPGDVGRRNDDGIGLLGGILIGGKQFLLLPVGVPALFDFIGGIALIQRVTTHGGKRSFCNPARD